MSDTPETDAAYKNHEWDMHDYIPLEFAQDLERERDKYRDQADALVDRLGQTQERMIDAERERDMLAEALSLAGKLCNVVHHPKSMQHETFDPCPVEALIKQALYKTP